MNDDEVQKLGAYLKKVFRNDSIRVMPRLQSTETAEVYVGNEFVGLLFVDEEEDERAYNFQMSILDIDLE